MELELRQQQLSYLSPVAAAALTQEESGECIVPDASPDIERILDTSGLVLLRGKECREGSCTASGSVRVWVVYLAEKETVPRRLELTIPFSARLEHPALTSDSQLCFRGGLRSLDTRVVNSRKVSVRAGLHLQLQGWSPAELSYTSGAAEQEGVFTQVEPCRVTVPTAVGEKSFVVSDELELPQGQPAVRELLRWDAALEVTDARLIGEKAVFKGVARIALLYTSEQESVEQWQTQLPFSQYMELPGAGEEDSLRIVPVLTGAELEPDGFGARLQLTLHTAAQCQAEAQRELPLLRDVYSVREQAHPTLRGAQIETLLDRQLIRQDCRETIPCPARRPAAARVLLDAPSQRQESDSLTVAADAQLLVLYWDDEGQLQSVARRVSVECRTALAAGCVCRPEVELAGELSCVPAAEGVELRFGVNFHLPSYAQADVGSVERCELNPWPEMERRPSVIVRAVGEDESLWTLAKHCRSSVEAIRAANALEGEPASGTLLLIPRVG